MKAIPAITLYLAIIAGLLAGEFRGIDWAENIAIFLAWFVTLAYWAGLFVGDDEIKTTRFTFRHYLVRALIVCIVMALAATGWLFSAGALAAGFAMFQVRYHELRTQREAQA